MCARGVVRVGLVAIVSMAGIDEVGMAVAIIVDGYMLHIVQLAQRVQGRIHDDPQCQEHQ